MFLCWATKPHPKHCVQLTVTVWWRSQTVGEKGNHLTFVPVILAAADSLVETIRLSIVSYQCASGNVWAGQVLRAVSKTILRKSRLKFTLQLHTVHVGGNSVGLCKCIHISYAYRNISEIISTWTVRDLLAQVVPSGQRDREERRLAGLCVLQLVQLARNVPVSFLDHDRPVKSDLGTVWHFAWCYDIAICHVGWPIKVKLQQ